MSCPNSVQIRRLETPSNREIEGLSDVLRDCVEGGASVGFMVPLTGSKTEAYWRSVLESATRGERVVLVAEEATGAIVGTVQVIWAQFENQPHRADVAKMLVHRRARRQGIGAALLAAAEHCALSADRTLLVLDTASSDAERLYVRRGWQRVGAVPGYALWPAGGFCSTTIFFKELRRGPSRTAAPDQPGNLPQFDNGGRPMRRIKSRKRGEERRGSITGSTWRYRIQGLRSSYARSR